MKVNTLYSGESTRELSDVIFEVASAANNELRAARALQTPSIAVTDTTATGQSTNATTANGRGANDVIPSGAWPALLPAVQCARFLDRLQHHRFDIFHPAIITGSSWEPLAMRLDLLRHKWSRKY